MLQTSSINLFFCQLEFRHELKRVLARGYARAALRDGRQGYGCTITLTKTGSGADDESASKKTSQLLNIHRQQSIYEKYMLPLQQI